MGFALGLGRHDLVQLFVSNVAYTPKQKLRL